MLITFKTVLLENVRLMIGPSLLLLVQVSCQLFGCDMLVASPIQDDAQEALMQKLIPQDKDACVIRWDLTGGFRSPPAKGFQKKPRLQVFADGRVVSGANSPELQDGQWQLTKKQLLDLMKEVVQEGQFFETSQADIRKQLEGYRSMLADGLTSEFEVQTADQHQTLSVYGLTMTARSFPDFAAFQRLIKLEKQFRELKLLADAGGPDAIEQLLVPVNQAMKKKDASLEPLGPESLASISRNQQGGVQARFMRQAPNQFIVVTLNRKTEDDFWDTEVQITGR